MNPKQFQELAHKLVGRTDALQAAAVRSSVSRSYYSLFLRVKAYAERLGVVFSKKKKTHEVHSDLAQALMWSSNSDIKELGDILHELRIKRNNADYELSHPSIGNPDLARDLILDAEKAHKIMEYLESNPAVSQKLVDDLNEYIKIHKG